MSRRLPGPRNKNAADKETALPEIPIPSNNFLNNLSFPNYFVTLRQILRGGGPAVSFTWKLHVTAGLNRLNAKPVPIPLKCDISLFHFYPAIIF